MFQALDLRDVLVRASVDFHKSWSGIAACSAVDAALKTSQFEFLEDAAVDDLDDYERKLWLQMQQQNPEHHQLFVQGQNALKSWLPQLQQHIKQRLDTRPVAPAASDFSRRWEEKQRQLMRLYDYDIQLLKCYFDL